MEIIKLREDFIKLGQALKAAGLVESGVDAKFVVQDGRVKVDGEVEYQDEEEIEHDIETGKLKSEKQIRLLRFLINNDDTYISDLEAFTDVTKSIMKTLEKNGYIEIYEKQIQRNPFINKNIDKRLNYKIFL